MFIILHLYEVARPDYTVAWASLPKKAFPKIITNGGFAKSGATVLSPLACGEIALGNSVMHCIAAHPSFSMVQRSNNGAMAATHALLLV
ncbi:MAG TPA: hypothetical protein DCL42_01800 [Deltaproteobacteria bacterium]|nr:hypothetical protein [Deltaproteobacteria bacterium]